MTSPPTVIAAAEVEGSRLDVRIEDGRVVAVGHDLARRGARVVDAGGGVLLPGLHDHHLHLLAMAAAAGSVRLDTPPGDEPAAFDRALQAAHEDTPPGAWIRAVGYDERHGSLDRQRLDRLAPGRPVRVQHRSGAAWIVSSPALSALGLDGATADGVDLDETGAPNGWLHRLDGLVAERLSPAGPPDLAPIGRRLAGRGVTGVTDATPFDGPGGFAALASARRTGALPQRVVVTGDAGLAGAPTPGELERGPVKVVVADHALPSIDDLAGAFRAARSHGRPVAVHCVSRVALVLALAAWDEVAPIEGDRIEHGSVVPVELIDRIRDLGLRVVTQPAFVADRGDRYLTEVDPDDRPHLYRCRSLVDAGIEVGGSTDAPFGPDDPWAAMAAAVERRTATGARLGPDEALTPRGALGLFLGHPERPGGAERRVEVGAPADLCLLAAPLDDVLADLAAAPVRACWVDGRPVALAP